MSSTPRKHLATAAFPLGKDMWKKELADHQKRLGSVKAMVPVAPSAASQSSAASRPGTQASRSGRSRPSAGGSANGRLGGSSPTKTHTAATCVTADTEAPPSKTLRVEDLDVSQQRTCHEMVSVLLSLSSAEARSVLEDLFVGSEMKRLLSNYTGVYPGNDGDAASPAGDTEHQGKQHSSDATASAAAAVAAAPATTSSASRSQGAPAKHTTPHSSSSFDGSNRRRESGGNESTASSCAAPPPTRGEATYAPAADDSHNDYGDDSFEPQ